MTIDPSKFSSAIVADTCSVWNMLSSRALFEATKSSRVSICITPMVRYECVIKHRKTETAEQTELLRRFHLAESDGVLPVHACDARDLLTIGRLAPSSLSSGELSCIATAYGIQSIAVMTDEKKARRFAAGMSLKVETTPRLYGWLHYSNQLTDSDHPKVIAEHESLERRPLTTFLNAAFEAALRSRARDRLHSAGTGTP